MNSLRRPRRFSGSPVAGVDGCGDDVGGQHPVGLFRRRGQAALHVGQATFAMVASSACIIAAIMTHRVVPARWPRSGWLVLPGAASVIRTSS